MWVLCIVIVKLVRVFYFVRRSCVIVMNDDSFAGLYQTGKSSVEHGNIDASGEDHPFGSEPKEFEAEMRTLIRKVADELYESWDETFREYLANAETATLQVQEWVENREESLYSEFDLIVGDDYSPQVDVVWDKKADRVVISNNVRESASGEQYARNASSFENSRQARFS